MIRILKVAFKRSVEISRDLDRQNIVQGAKFRSPLWEGEAESRLDLHPGFISLLIEGRSGADGKPVRIGKLFPIENADYIDVEPEDLKATLSKDKR
jgi:hypothetical protein